MRLVEPFCTNALGFQNVCRGTTINVRSITLSTTSPRRGNGLWSMQVGVVFFGIVLIRMVAHGTDIIIDEMHSGLGENILTIPLEG